MQIKAIETAGAEVVRAEFSADMVALEAAVAFLVKRLIERRNTIPILSHIRIEASPAGEVTLTGSDRDNWASVTVPAMVYSPGAVCVDAGPFADALAKVRKGKCPQATVEHGENGARLSRQGAPGSTLQPFRLMTSRYPLPANWIAPPPYPSLLCRPRAFLPIWPRWHLVSQRKKRAII